MNSSIKVALSNPQSSCFQLRASLFHSTPVLDRGRRNYWNARYSRNHRRPRNQHFKQDILRNVSAYAEYLFQSWKSDFEHDDEPPNRGPSSWSRHSHHDSGPRRNWTRNQGRQTKGKRGYQFCEDDDDVENVFRSAFEDRFFFWSFVHDDYPNWRSSSRFNNRYKTSWRWRHYSEDEYDSSEADSSESDIASERVALGLSASGPLKLEDVKIAYRACALKWHPDRHQGASKTAAEEKFKLCTAAYQSLCDKLAVN